MRIGSVKEQLIECHAELVLAIELGENALLVRCEESLVVAQMSGLDYLIGCSDRSSAPEGVRSIAAEVKDRDKSKLIARYDLLILTISGFVCTVRLGD